MGVYEVKTQDQEDPFSKDIVALAADVPIFEKDRHVKYWLRCLRTPLPQPYTSNDSNRMTLAFFTLSALDLLGVLFTRTTLAERQEYVEWIYGHQHRDGGFRGFSATSSKDEEDDESSNLWDPATLSATYFALGSLSVLADDLKRVKRRRCLAWLQEMQRPDGSFGDFLGPNGLIEGGMDTRFGYFAACIRWWLRLGVETDGETAIDIDVEGLIGCIAHSQTYDGGVSEEPFREAHAGFTYCAVATLACLDRLGSATCEQSNGITTAHVKQTALTSGIPSRDHTIRWLIRRLTAEIEADSFDDSDNASYISAQSVTSESNPIAVTSGDASKDEEGIFTKLRSRPASLEMSGSQDAQDGSSAPLLESETMRTHWTGFNGRANKVADTCYAFWVGGSLKILDAIELVDLTHVRNYLLEKTQHMIAGGFGKMPGDLPDIYHAYLGLAALALIDGHEDDGATLSVGMEDASCVVEGQAPKAETSTREGDDRRTIRALDPILCISVGARRWIEGLEWRRANYGT